MNSDPRWIASPRAAGAIESLLRAPDRLEAVRSTGLLDSGQEDSFDALTRLAARLLNTPSSFVSVIDSERDFYKSQVGFDSPLAEQREVTGRTLCHYTLAADATLAIDDTHESPLWMTVPAVHRLGVRAYVGVPLKVGQETVGSFCVMDTRPRQWAEGDLETLRQLALSAGRELSLRAALSTARADTQHAHALARSREEVVALVAHDLRTPLQVLELSSTLLRRQGTAAHALALNRMDSAIEAMKTMADSLLGDSGLLAPLADGRRTCAVESVVKDAIAMMAPIAERDEIRLVPGETAQGTLRIDYSLMLRVLGNVLGNAIKYSARGNAVSLSARREGDLMSLTVADNGIGMTAQEQARAFERGWQGAPGMVRGDGAGLGLSIVKKLVQEHAGHVTLHSVAGEGTSLTVSLPCH